MRLIDADKLIEILKNDSGSVLEEALLGIVRGQPTAFDLERVIKRLEDHKEEIKSRKERDILNKVAKFAAIKAIEADIEILKSAANIEERILK